MANEDVIYQDEVGSGEFGATYDVDPVYELEQPGVSFHDAQSPNPYEAWF